MSKLKINHELKIVPCYFQEIIAGNKTFEVSHNMDRGFQKGDIVKLREYDPVKIFCAYTGKECLIKIKYVTNAYQKEGYVVFGFEVLPEKESEVGYE